MFILTPIVINPSLTSKRAHVCSPTVIVSSSSLRFLKIFPLFALLGFPSVREKTKRLQPPFYCQGARLIFLFENIIFQIPTVRMCENGFPRFCSNFRVIQWLTSSGSQLYQDRFWVSARKKKAQCEGNFFHHTLSQKCQRWVCAKNKFQIKRSHFTTIQRLTSTRSSFY